MKILSLKVTKKEIYYSVLSKNTNGEINLENDTKICLIDNSTIPELMRFFKDTFDNLLNSEKVDKVIYWCELECKSLLAMPLGILNLCCAERNIPTDSRYGANITDKRLGFNTKEQKTAKVIKRVDELFPNCSYKNDDMRKVIAIGLIVLKEAK